MKNSLLVVLSTTLFGTFPYTYAQVVSPPDTLKTTLIRPYANQSERGRIGSDFPLSPNAYLLSPDLSALRLLNSYSSPKYLAFDLPISGTQSLPLLIHEIAVVSSDFQAHTSSGKALPQPTLKYYAGKVAGDDSSTVALSISDKGIEGLVYGQAYSYTLGKMRSTTSSQLHVVYPTQEQASQTEMSCKPEAMPVPEAASLPVEASSRRNFSSDCRGVAVYLEVDYQMYQDWGSDPTYITSKILATLANVVILYAKEDIKLEVSELKIWDTPDPYGQAGTPSDLLFEFKKYWNARNNTFNGDIAHLLSTHISSGGVAYYGISRRNSNTSLSDISAVFSDQPSRSFAFGLSTGIYDPPLNPLPAYSYNVYIIAHEIGHNFGLPHTHSCLWDGGPLDSCSSVEDGTCPPRRQSSEQGTIMSYCPNLAKGFGTQPSAKMKYEFLAAQNLMNPGANPVQITPTVLTANQGQYMTLDIANCTGKVLWSDGVSTGNSHTILPSESTAVFAACLESGCLSAPAKTTLITHCVEPAACSVSASGDLSPLYGIGTFSFNTLLTETPNGVAANLGTFYDDLTCTQHSLVKAGESYPFTLSGTLKKNIFAKIYIDYNGNGEFTEDDELVYNGLALANHSGTIMISPTALRGTPLRMRVMVNPVLIPDACSLPSTLATKSGKVNDYALTVTDSTCPPHFRESVKSGRWDDPLVWSCGDLPTALDEVRINQGHYITLPTDFSGFAGALDLRGVVQPSSNSRLGIEYP